jgi:hypothetical protein
MTLFTRVVVLTLILWIGGLIIAACSAAATE